MDGFLAQLRDNAFFLLTFLMLFLCILLAAYLCEHGTKSKRIVRPTKYLAVTSLCAALSALLMLIELPLFFAPAFYKLDFSELPVLICGFYLGPVAGVLCELLKILLKLLLKGTETAFVGEFANFIVGCVFVLPAVLVYHAGKSRKTALIGLAAGTLCLTVFGSLFNAVYLLPKFAILYGIPLETIVSMGSAVNASIQSVETLVFYAVVPFNLLKGIAVSVLTFLLYKRVARTLFSR